MLEGLQAIVSETTLFDLSREMKQGMPIFRAHSPFMFSLAFRHGDLQIPGGISMTNDIAVMCTHTGTHIDAVGHFSRNGCLYGGFDAREATADRNGLRWQGIETMAPILRRAVLLDVASFKGVEALGPAYAITGAELEEAAKAEGVTVNSGDAVLIRTGWGRFWDSPAKYIGAEGGSPGPDVSGAEWIVRNGASLTGSDTATYEADPGDGGGAVHAFLLADHAVPIMENLDLDRLAQERIYSFLLFVSPLKIVGATASPVRPIAICRKRSH